MEQVPAGCPREDLGRPSRRQRREETVFRLQPRAARQRHLQIALLFPHEEKPQISRLFKGRAVEARSRRAVAEAPASVEETRRGSSGSFEAEALHVGAREEAEQA